MMPFRYDALIVSNSASLDFYQTNRDEDSSEVIGKSIDTIILENIIPHLILLLFPGVEFRRTVCLH